MKKPIKITLILALLIIPSTTFAQDAIPQEYIHWFRNSSGLENKIATLPQKVTDAITIPVLFGVRRSNISPNFGDPRSGGRTHKGEDIMAVKGTPIISPTPAIVIKVGTGPTEGHYVYTANPGGETFVYMHLDSPAPVSVGKVLEKGDLIGYVGNTGNASGGAAHLHFEVHTSQNGAVDPYPRITLELTLTEKGACLQKIINSVTDKGAFATNLILIHKKELESMRLAGVSLPAEIQVLLSPVALAAPTVQPTPAMTASPSQLNFSRNLALGFRGDDVKLLQTFLISQNRGVAARALGIAGATGYFGAITRNALAEYQASVGIKPSYGYFGVITRAFIRSLV